MKRWVFGLVLLVGVGALALLALPEPEPSIRPEDVVIKAVLLPPGRSENPPPGHEEHWALEITLESLTDRPLHVSDREWFSHVTPYVEGMPVLSWDFKQGLSNGATVGGEGFAIGADGRQAILAAKALGAQGIAITADEAFGIMGFEYYEESFPAEIRYFLPAPESASVGRRAYVVYSHYERRWGRDLSWAKAFPVDSDSIRP